MHLHLLLPFYQLQGIPRLILYLLQLLQRRTLHNLIDTPKRKQLPKLLQEYVSINTDNLLDGQFSGDLLGLLANILGVLELEEVGVFGLDVSHYVYALRQPLRTVLVDVQVDRFQS